MSSTNKTISLLEPDFIKSLESLNLISRKIFKGLLKGERRSQKKGVSIEFADYRDYVQGDDLRCLDWNIFGRLDRLLLKLFQEEEDLNIFFLIDNSLSMDFGTPSKFFYAKQVAAALGYIALNNLDRVGVYTFSSQLEEIFPLSRGKQSSWKLFDSLEQASISKETNIYESFRHFALRNKHRGLVVVLSDFMDPQGLENAFKFFSPRKYDLFLVQILSQEEVDPSLVGDIRLMDAEWEQHTDLSISDELLQKYQFVLKGFLEHLRLFCHKRDISYIFSTNQIPLEELILNYLRQFGLLR